VIPSGSGASGKAPLVNWTEFQSKLPDDDQLSQWEQEFHPRLWGIVTGQVSGVVVIDADDIETRTILEKEGLKAHIITPRGGGHFYFQHPGHHVKTVAGLLPKLDVRADGGFCNVIGKRQDGDYQIVTLPTPDTLYPWNRLPKRILAALNGSKQATKRKQGEAILDGQRDATLISIAGAMRRQGADQAAIEVALLEINAKQCKPPLPKNQVLEKAKSIVRYEPARDTGEPAHFHLTDYGNAERLAKQFGNIIRYIPERGLWLVWNGKVWEWDRGGVKIAKLAKKTVRNIYREAADEDDDKQRSGLVKHAIGTERQARLDSMIKNTESEVDILLAELDVNLWFLCVNNGTIDLKTGTVKRHDPADLITKIVPIDYDPEAKCPLWEKFLDDTTDGDEDLKEYLQLIAGVCLTGDMLDQVFFYLYGLGQNGKSTFTDKLLEIAGDYGMRVDSEMFMVADKGKGSATESIANIRGKRVIVSSEVPEGRKLNTGLLKDLTGGGEAIRARRLYEHEIEFKPTGKIVMFGNYKPTISESTRALWRRLKLVPFSHTVEDKDRDQFLGDKLSKELPGILAWAVRGCLRWQAIRFLDEPDAVTNATREYRGEEDLIADFLSDICELGPELTIDQAGMKKAYHQWCEENSIMPLGPKKFGIRLIEKHCRKTHVKGIRSWVGVTLRK